MYSKESTRSAFAAVLVLSAALSIACNKAGNDGESASAASDGGKIPITTKSEEARKEFLRGRDLSERLLAQDSLQHFDKAITLDPDFASAELARANSSPTAKEFFEHLRKAAGLVTKTSEAEKLVILANEAAANGVTEIQKQYLDQLVAAHPNDERAQLNLGNYYFGQQEYEQAIAHYKKATQLAPSYSPAYNILGYAHRQQGNYGDAEQAFKKYVELIPNDPNPYDSYAELLLKMGRFDESIAQYRKALAIDPHFAPSHFGIAADLMYQGQSQEAVAELQTMAEQARNDGELRTALFGMAVVAADSGKLDNAVQQMDKEYAVAEKKNDVAAMAADLQAKGNILAEAQRYDAAAQQFDRSLQMVEGSSLSQDIKDNAKRLHHFNLAALAIGKKDYNAAKSHAQEFRQSAEASKNPAQLKQAHELAGRIALAEKDYDKAIAELEQANQQDPRNLYRLGQAYQGKGDSAKAQDSYKKAAEFNSLPALNYAFIRRKAQKVEVGQKA
ncbi:MAG TPA: tetratricopeptide repeat protein [Terriglobales bacterium]|nr:tetratricopeptide repeat protein [Terriglobales bacterium]